MAEVFQAEVESIEGFKKQVAIKRVLPHLSQNRQFIEMFLSEQTVSVDRMSMRHSLSGVLPVSEDF